MNQVSELNNSSSHVLTQLLKAVVPNTAGIIWVGEKPLEAKSPYFYELNYLVDGLLTTKQGENPHQFNFYMSSQFGKPFFLSTLIVSKESDVEELKKIKTLLSSGNEESEVLVINQSNIANDKKIEKELKQFFSSIQYF